MQSHFFLVRLRNELVKVRFLRFFCERRSLKKQNDRYKECGRIHVVPQLKVRNGKTRVELYLNIIWLSSNDAMAN